MTIDFQKAFRTLIALGFPKGKVLTFLLDVNGYSLTRLAHDNKIPVSTISKTLKEDRNNAAVRNAVCCVLNFDPWE